MQQIKRISIPLFSLFLFFIQQTESYSLNHSVNILQIADSLYSNRNYHQALNHYLQVFSTDDLLKNDAKLNFKMGYCYYKNKEYNKAKLVLGNKNILNGLLPEYTEYFYFRSTLRNKNDDIEIEVSGINYLNTFSDHFLADSVRFWLAEYYFKKGKYSTAQKYYSYLIKKKIKSFQNSYIYKQIALCKYEVNEKLNALDRIKQILKKYPSTKEALELINFLQQKKIKTDAMFFLIMEVYYQHRRFDLLNKKLEEFIHSSSNELEIEKARFYLLKVYFSRGEYPSALYGFKNIIKNLKNKKLKPKVLIYIARSYLLTGEKEKAARTYIQYSQKFPRRRLASEAAWKAAWIYEEENNLAAALNQYRAVQKHWPRSNFRYEAAFREGFTLFRMMYYEKAAEIFKQIAQSRWNSDHKDRAKYWLALTYAKLKMNKTAFEITLELGRNLFDNYYTTKAYLLNKSYMDSTMNINTKLSIKENPLQQHYSSIAMNVERYERLFQIYEVLGKEFVLSEISSIKYKEKDLSGWVTLAEIYKKLGDYNGAFKIYDLIDYTYFGESHSLEKPFLLKEKYPFYFDLQIEKICQYRHIEKNFILAIIREESGFDKNAHSWANAYGLMQIIPETAKQLSSEINTTYTTPADLFNENLNLELGIYYISKLAKKYNDNKEMILAAYNAGPHRVERWSNINEHNNIDYFIENIEYSQTRNYVKKVMKNYWIYSILNDVN